MPIKTGQMFLSPSIFVLIVTVLAVCQPQDSCAQFFQPQNGPYAGSLSRARSTGNERQLQFGGLGLSQGVVNSQSVTRNNGGFRNGGDTSIANSRSQTGALNLGGLQIGSTLTASKTRTNGDVSRGLSHDFNVGEVGIGSSFSRDNLRNGFGLHRSSNGGVQLGLGLLNFDLSRHQQQQPSQAATQAYAQAQGEDAFARSNNDAYSRSQQFGGLGFTQNQFQSNALSGTRQGQTSAGAGGLTGGSPGSFNNFGIFRARRSAESTSHENNVRPKRRVQFIPFAYPGSEFDRSRRQLGRGLFSFEEPNNGFGLPLEQYAKAEQSVGANAQINPEVNEISGFQNNGASSMGSDLVTDYSLTNESLQRSTEAQSQAFNVEDNQQQATKANAGTKQLQTKNGERVETHVGSQATISNIANIQVHEEGNTPGFQADNSSQSFLQGDSSGQNSTAQTNANVKTVKGADGLVSNTASSQTSTVSQGGQNNNAVTTDSGSNENKGLGDASSNADSLNDLSVSGGDGQANAPSSLDGAQGFADVKSGSEAFKVRKRKSSSYYTQLRPQQQQKQASLSTLEIINDSKEINWPENRIQLYNHYPQQQQQQQKPQQLLHQPEQQQPQQKHQQQLHYSSINPNSSSEQFAVIDENERHGRTFTFITDFINRLTQRTCVYPCTLEAYQEQRCCETAVVVPQTPPNGCCEQPLPPRPLLHPSTTIVRPPSVLPPSSLQSFPSLTYPFFPTQCCVSCPVFGYYGQPPCMQYTIPGSSPGRLTFFMG